jgi:GGDEF domain-containing protein
MGASVGISVYAEDGDRAETLLAAADQEMYREKSGHSPVLARV